MATAPQVTVTPDFAIAYRDLVVRSIAAELPVTRRVLEAVPDARRDYRPDPKARTAGELSWHIAAEDVLFLDQIAEKKFAFPDSRYEKQEPKTSAAVGTWYEKNLNRALDKIRALTPTDLVTPINFLNLYNFPAVFYLDFMVKHSVHHRGQLAAYLRPMGSKVPAIYGGSADEPMNL